MTPPANGERPDTLLIHVTSGQTFRVLGTIKDAKRRGGGLWKIEDLGPGLTPIKTYWLNPEHITFMEEVPAR